MSAYYNPQHQHKKDNYFTEISLNVFISLHKYFSNDPKVKIQSLRGIGFEVDFPTS